MDTYEMSDLLDLLDLIEFCDIYLLFYAYGFGIGERAELFFGCMFMYAVMGMLLWQACISFSFVLRMG